MTEIETLFERLPELPAIPKVVQNLIATMEDEEADLASLAQVVSHEPTLSARVLRLANSSFYGSQKKIGSIQEAVTRIGLNALRSLVITSGLTQAFKTVPGIALHDFWRHALLSAGLARGFAHTARLDVEFAYTAALMHRIGALLLHLAFPDEASRLTDKLVGASAAERCAIERKGLGVDHCSAGAELARQWNFPLAIRNGLAAYAYPTSPQASPFAAIVALASQSAGSLIAGGAPEAIAEALPLDVLERVTLDRETALNVLTDGPELLRDAASFL